MNNRGKGVSGERYAYEYLKKAGYKVLYRNKKVVGVEIDIIAVQNNVLAFIEVKTRESKAFGRGIEAVDKNRQKRYIRAATSFVTKQKYQDFDVRFDVIEVDGDKVEHVEDAYRP